MIIKMVNEFKLTVVHVAHPNPMETRCRSVHVRGVTAGQKTVENQDWAAGRGPWRAVGRWPLGRWPAFSKTHTKTLNQLLAAIIAKSSLKFQALT